MKNLVQIPDVRKPDDKPASELKIRWNQLAMPLGSLEQLCKVVQKIATIQGNEAPNISKAEAWVFCGDHGLARNNIVNAYPAKVTRLMLKTFLKDKATVSSLCKANNIRINVANSGVETDHLIEPPKTFQGTFLNPKNTPRVPTGDILVEKALTEDQLKTAWQIGLDAIEDTQKRNGNLVILGDMGIGNTTTSTALIAILLNLSDRELEPLIGSGAGLPKEKIPLKFQAVQKILSRFSNIKEQGEAQDNLLQLLKECSGYEIVSLVSAILKASELRIPILLDGMIVSTAAFIAKQFNQNVSHFLIPASLSKEPIHHLILQNLDLELSPILSLNLALGEGSAAAIGYSVIKNALSILNDTATLGEVLELESKG